MSTSIVTGSVFEDSGSILMGRIRGPAASYITQAAISSIAYSVFELTTTAGVTSASETATGTLTVASVVFDALQTDARWTRDGIGYNFRWDAAASLVPTGGKRYRFEVKFTPASGEAFHVVFVVEAVALYRS